MKIDLILKIKQNLFSKVIWSSTFNVVATYNPELDVFMFITTIGRINVIEEQFTSYSAYVK